MRRLGSLLAVLLLALGCADAISLVSVRQALVKEFPADSSGLANLALAHFYLRDMKSAREFGQQASELSPRNVVQKNNLALFAMYSGDFEAAERIAREAALLASLFTPATERLWRGPFVPPVPGNATSSFGRVSVFNGEPRGRHQGADFSASIGTPIRAPNAGRVVLAMDLYFSVECGT